MKKITRNYKVLEQVIGKLGIRALKTLDNKPNGTFCSVVYKTNLEKKIAAAHKGDTVLKVTCASNLRKGINGSNTARAKARKLEKENNNVNSVVRPCWWHRVNGDDPTLVTNKDESKYYLCFNPTGMKSTSTWFYNGKEVSKDFIKEQGILQPSYWKDEEPEMLFIDAKNVISVK